MHTIQINVLDKSFYPHLKVLLDSFAKDNKVEIKENYILPDSLTINSIEEVKKRVFEAEERIKDGKYLTEDDYNKKMNDFFKTELGIDRW